MKIYLIGNPLVKTDCLPLKLKPHLTRAFPKAEVLEADPSETFIPEENSVIIDTVYGLKKPQLFATLGDFTANKSVSVHDYDLYLHLMLLQKLGKLKQFYLIGIPQVQQNLIRKILPRVLFEICKISTI